MPDLCIGISGWTYAPWRGTFYPRGLAQKRELAYASRQLNSIEINGSFYSLQRPSSYRQWYRDTPEGFVFSVKAGRFITHMRKLKDVEAPLANFIASGLLALNEKLGPILWQLPPSLGFDPDRLERFFDLLPHDTKEAARMARRHDARLNGRAWTKTDANRPLRHAMEVRHETFKTPEFVKLLREHDVALVVADTAGKWPFMEDLTSRDLVYVRLHGEEQLYVSGYDDAALETWAAKIRAWASGKSAPGADLTGPPAKARKAGRDVFVYFDNDVKVRAPYDAMNLSAKLAVRERPGEAPDPVSIAEQPRPTWAAIRRRRRSRAS
ncbi:MAG TPA: DUF72 domain-containing protein [Tepidisphaeraceae bacterium]